MAYPKIQSRGQTIEIRSRKPDLVAIERWWFYGLLLTMWISFVGIVARLVIRLVGAA